MRILHINNEKTWRGGERQTLLLAGALLNRGLTVALGCRPAGPLAEQAAKHKVPVLPMAGGSLRALKDLIRAAKSYDLVHCHTARSHSLAFLAGAIHRRPLVVTRRVDFLPKQNWFNRLKYRRAARVVCISQFIARQLQDWGVPQDKLVVIRSAVPIPPAAHQAPDAAQELRAKLGINPGKKLVGNIAALVGHKDHATFLRTAREVAAQRDDVVFVVIGDGELKPDLLRLRAELDLEKTVHFLGFIPQAERCLRAFDVFAMSSCMEGLGSIVLDAFAAGVPVAATAGGGLPELVRPEETGLLAPVGDAAALATAIIRLLDDAKLREQLRAAARHWVEQECSVDRMATGYLELYRAVLGVNP